jgi:flagellar hook protein FlgE
MMRSMFAGVSGLRNHQIRMDVIGNNIANVNTAGYKGGRATFQDTLNQVLRGASAPQAGRGGMNALQVGLGVSIASIDIIHTQGNLQNTGKVTDLALQGDGFFIVGDGSQNFYTRAGMFALERDGRLVHPSNGLTLQGWMADQSGYINTTSPIMDIHLPIGQTLAPIVTDTAEYMYNLNSNTNGLINYNPNPQTITDSDGNSGRITFVFEPTGNFNEWTWEAVVTGGSIVSGGSGAITMNSDGTVQAITGSDFDIDLGGASPINVTIPNVGDANGGAFIATGGTTSTFSGNYTAPEDGTTTSRVVDSLGNVHTVYTRFSKTSNNNWEWEATLEGVTVGSGSLVFDSAGRLTAATGGPIAFDPPGAATVNVFPDFEALTQYSGATSVTSAANGYAMGTLESFNINKTGQIIGVFSNGLTQALGQVAIANFNNPPGLIRVGDTMFSESGNSGVPMVGAAGRGGRGEITPGTLEMSNVDLAQEFTDMIVTQRGFQANSRIITTSDEMLQELVNLKR